MKIVTAANKMGKFKSFKDGIALFTLTFTYSFSIFWRNLVETHLWAREVPGLQIVEQLWLEFFSSAPSLQ